MKKHLTEIELIEFVAGNLKADRVAAHLATCAECAGRLEEMRRTWDLLGRWVPPMVPSIPARAARFRWTGLLKAAAALVVAAGLGFFAGRLAAQRGEDPTDALAWEVLQVPTPAGLAEPLLGLFAAKEDSP